MVLLHEEHLRHFVHTWRLALANSVSLPPSDDPAYASLGALGQHVLGAAGGYMVWMCEVLTLPDPEIRSAPDAAAMGPRCGRLHGARSGSAAGTATGSFQRAIGDSRVPIAMAGKTRLGIYFFPCASGSVFGLKGVMSSSSRQTMRFLNFQP